MDAKCLSKSEEMKSKGNECFKAGNYEDSIDWYSKAIAACDIEDRILLSVLYCNRGFANLKLNRYQSALDDTSHSFELNANYDKPLYYRFKARLALGQKFDALADITAVCVLQKESNKRIVMERDKCFFDYITCKPIPLNVHPIMASDTFINDYFKNFSNHPLVNGSVNADKLLKLLEDLKSNTDDVNRNAKIAIIEGAICEFNLNFKVGELWLGSVANTVRDDKLLQVVSLIQLASLKFVRLFVEKRISVESIKCIFDIFARALKIDENNVDIWFNRSFVHFAIGNYVNGLKDLQHCHTLSPSFEQPYAERYCFSCSEILRANDTIQFNHLCIEIEEYIDLHPESSLMYYTYALILKDSGNLVKADEMITKALSLNSTEFKYHFLKAVITCKLSLAENVNPRTAIPYFITALEVDAHEFVVYEEISNIECETGHPLNGIIYIDKGLAVLKGKAGQVRLNYHRGLLNSRIKACKTLNVNYLDANFSTNVTQYFKLWKEPLWNATIHEANV